MKIKLISLFLTLSLLLSACGSEIDLSREPSYGLSYDKTSVVSDTYILVGIGACKDANIMAHPEKNGMPVVAVGSNAFFKSQKIKSIVLPESITTVGSSAFAYCENLKAVIFGGKLSHIGDSAFRYCTSLEEITLPKSISVIGRSAFSHCKNLKKIHFGGTKAEWYKINFGKNWDVGMPKYTVFCSDGELLPISYIRPAQ